MIYARVPEAVKTDVEGYAGQHGLTLSSAAADLLQRGMAAAADERSIASLEMKLAKMSSEKVLLTARLQTTATEVGALRLFAQRAAVTKVGPCPNCRAPISGMDLLGQGRCTT